jgi:hypothetical protein
VPSRKKPPAADSASERLADGLERDGYPRPTLTTIQTRMIDASERIALDPPERVDYLHAVLCQVGLPRSKTTETSFERTSGNASLLVKAGELWNGKEWVQQPLPYGTRPRLALVHISSEAIRTKSRVIEIGHSVRDFLVKLGADTSGHEYARFKTQMKALAACEMRVGIGAATIKSQPIERFEAWLHSTGQQTTLWAGTLELSEKFFETLREYAVPMDARALCALKHSALALDVYTWLAHRLHRVNSISGVKVSWENLREQFGQEYSDPKNFKKEMVKAIRAVLSVYPTAHVEDVPGGLLLLPSPAPVRKIVVPVGKSE